MNEGKDKNSDAYVAVHIEKGNVQFTEIIVSDKNVLIEQKTGGNDNTYTIINREIKKRYHTEQKADRYTVKYPRDPKGCPYAKDFWYRIQSVLPVKIQVLQSIEDIKSCNPEYDGKNDSKAGQVALRFHG